MIGVIFGLIIIGVSVFFGTAFVLSFFPDWVQDSVGLGCGCLVALFGILAIVIPIILVVLALIGAFCD